MAESAPLQILLAHDRWATAQLLDACDKLPPDAFHRRFDMGPGSLHDALTHVVGAMRAWTDTLAGWPARPRPEGDGRRRTPADLRALYDVSWQELSAERARRPLAETVTRQPREGPPIVISRAAVLVHVATHGMHHRAQCLNMLRQVGATPLPPSSVTEWAWAGEPRP